MGEEVPDKDWIDGNIDKTQLIEQDVKRFRELREQGEMIFYPKYQGPLKFYCVCQITTGYYYIGEGKFKQVRLINAFKMEDRNNLVRHLIAVYAIPSVRTEKEILTFYDIDIQEVDLKSLQTTFETQFGQCKEFLQI